MVRTYFVVTGIVENNGKILILKKSPNDCNYPNKWSFCSGFVKEFEPAEESVLREIKEETGLKGEIVKAGKVIDIFDKQNNKRWLIAPYLCRARSSKVRLCHENADFRWVKLSELEDYEFVPGLTKDLRTLGLL